MKLGALAGLAALALSFMAPEAVGQTERDRTLAQPRNADDEARFRFFTNCNQFRIEVTPSLVFGYEAEMLSVTLAAVVENRLRAANLYSENGFNTFFVGLVADYGSYGIGLTYKKKLYDPVSGLALLFPVWERGINGSMNEDMQKIAKKIDMIVALFASDYLRVNEEACTTR